MKIQEIGRIIQKLRIENRISLEELGNGICSVATLSRLEAGERRPDILIFNAIWQRLGRSSDYLDVVLTLEEFEYFIQRRNVEIALEKGEYEQVLQELNVLEASGKEENPLKRQDIHKFQALNSLYNQNNQKAAIEYLRKAIQDTIPEFDEQLRVKRLWLSENETTLLLAYAFLIEEMGKNGRKLLEQIQFYLQSKDMEEEARNRRIAQTRHLLARIRKKEGDWENCWQDCEAVIEAEVRNGSLTLIYQAMKLEMECCTSGIVKEKNEELRKKQFDALESVLKEYVPEMIEEHPLLFFREVSQEKHLIDELIYNGRLRNEWSQEKLSDGICTTETLSRIENGRRNPTIKKFHAIMEKLGTGMGYYNTDFDAEKFETLEKARALRREMLRLRYKEAREILDDIKSELDLRLEKNQQFVDHLEIIFSWRLGEIDTEEALKKVEKILDASIGHISEKTMILHQLKSIEISLINQLAILYRNLGETEKAVEILTLVNDYYKKSKLSFGDMGDKRFTIMKNLSSYLEECDRLKEADVLCRKTIEELIRSGNGLKLCISLIASAYIKERREEKIDFSKYQQAYFLSDLYRNTANLEIIKNHLENRK